MVQHNSTLAKALALALLVFLLLGVTALLRFAPNAQSTVSGQGKLPLLSLPVHETTEHEFFPDLRKAATIRIARNMTWSAFIKTSAVSAHDVILVEQGATLHYDAAANQPFRALVVEGTLVRRSSRPARVVFSATAIVFIMVRSL